MSKKTHTKQDEVLFTEKGLSLAKTPRSHHVIVRLRNVYKSYSTSLSHVHALKDIDLTLYSGEFVIIHGPSGCGKSTLLHTMLGLEKPTKGTVELRKENLYTMSNDERTKYRREKIGMIFQQSNWIKSLNVLENIAYPLLLDNKSQEETLEKAEEILKKVGMESFAHQKPMELSGGQQQRIALARALVSDPWIIMADEPTGNLDSESSHMVVDMLAWLNRKLSRAVIMVTHEDEFLPVATRRIHMKDGEIIADEHD